jgi:sugar phosphate isomerase/epimerase
MPVFSPAAQTTANSGRRRLISLAHLSLIQTVPTQLMRIASAAGFDLVDLRLAPATPTDPAYSEADLKTLCRELAAIRDDTGLCIWDVEIIRVNDQTRPEAYLPLMEAAAALGAKRMKLVCDSEDGGRTSETLGHLCDLAAPFGLVLDLEYMVFSGVRSLQSALKLVEATGRTNLTVLVDALHWVRAGDSTHLVPVHLYRLGYVQLCDGPLQGPTNRQALIQEARTNRLAPGEGEFPLDALLEAVPPLCVASVEVPLPPDREPLAHARRLLEATRAMCERHDREAAQ